MRTVGDLQTFQTIAEGITRESRNLVLSRLSRGFGHELKADGTFVTDIDTEVERLIRARITDAFPDHQILGEELGSSDGRADYLWVIDPIDGTHSLRHGLPLFGTLLALRHRSRTIVGAVDLPAMDKTYVAAAGCGARYNGRRCQLRDVPSRGAIQQEIIGVGERNQFTKADKAAIFDRLMASHGSIRTYCDCFGHALTFEGCLGAMVDYNLRIWDMAASELIVREAGGVFVHVNKQGPVDPRKARFDVVFGKPTVVRWVVETLGLEADI